MMDTMDKSKRMFGASILKPFSSPVSLLSGTYGQHASPVRLGYRLTGNNAQANKQLQEKALRVISYAYDTAGQITSPGIILPRPELDVVLNNELRTLANSKIVRLCAAEPAEKRARLDPLVVSALSFDPKVTSDSLWDEVALIETCGAVNKTGENCSVSSDSLQGEDSTALSGTPYLSEEESEHSTEENLQDDRSRNSPLICEQTEQVTKRSGTDLETDVEECLIQEPHDTSVIYSEETHGSSQAEEVCRGVKSGSESLTYDDWKDEDDEKPIKLLETFATSDIQSPTSSITSDIDDSSGDEEGNDGEMFQYACYLCSFMSKSAEEVMLHFVRKHLDQKPFLCAYCNLAFSESYEAQIHIEEKHNGPILIQMQQSKVYSNPLFLEISKTDSVDELDTDICTHFQLMEVQTSTPSSVSQAAEERKESLVSQSFHCVKCNYYNKSETSTDIEAHIKERHADFKPFHCHLCKWSFSYSEELKKHIHENHQLSHEFANRDSTKRKEDVRNDEPVCDNSKTLAPPKKALSENQSQTNKVNIVVIPNSELWESEQTAHHATYRCKLCPVSTATEPVVFITHKSVWLHVTGFHNYPSSLHCPTCVKEISLGNSDRLNNWVQCTSCQEKVFFVSNWIKTAENAKECKHDLLFVCKVCTYRTAEKSRMTRHIKFQHTNCRPFACPLCDYVAVDRPKVVHHAREQHPDLETDVIYHEEEAEKFKSDIKQLFKTLTFLCYDDEANFESQFAHGVGLTGQSAEEKVPETCEFPSVSGNQNKPLNKTTRGKAKRINKSKAVRRTNGTHVIKYKCTLCNFHYQSSAEFKRHFDANHMKPNKEFRCTICGCTFQCRSKIGRHIKGHLKLHPHACSLCDYSSVEKSKVNVHTQHVHCGEVAEVVTDVILEQKLNEDVRMYYTEENNLHQVDVPIPNAASVNVTDELKIDSHLPLEESQMNPPVPKILVLNVHNKNNKAEINAGGHVLKINMSGYVRQVAQNESTNSCFANTSQVKEEPMEAEPNLDSTPFTNGIKKEPPDNWFSDKENSFTPAGQEPIKVEPGSTVTESERTAASGHPKSGSIQSNVSDVQPTVVQPLPHIVDSNISVPVASTVNPDTGEKIPWTLEYYNSSSDEAEGNGEAGSGGQNVESDRKSLNVELSPKTRYCNQSDLTSSCIVKSESMNSTPETSFNINAFDGTSPVSPVHSNTSVGFPFVFDDHNSADEEDHSLSFDSCEESYSIEHNNGFYLENMAYDPKLHVMKPIVRLEDIIQTILSGHQ